MLPQSFPHESFGEVRIVTGPDGEPRWVAADVCRVLELVNVTRSLDRLDDDEKGVHTVNTLGGPQEILVVTEAGLWSLVLTSRKAEAKAFKRWLTQEVIPSICRTGAYAL
ncbi:BRO-N domain-containing protein [Tautonia marina]|uniref:BRO-N domain-containing protein n=1 Tax=Tautonia marina TaxID=2653855 RepID=UPI0012605144|nr:Bro-N domain-containing protein [Tautonia marina]